MAEARLETIDGIPQHDSTGEGERAWPPRLWNWKHALFIMVIWTTLFVVGNIAQAVVLLIDSGVTMDMLVNDPNAVENLDFVFTFRTQVVTFIAFGFAAFASVGIVNAVGPKHSLREFGLRPMERRWLWISVVMGVVLAGVRLGIGYGLFAIFPALQEGAEALSAALVIPDATLLQTLMSVFFIAIFVPIYEEVFFRGFLHNALRNRLAMWPAIVLSSLAFGLIHFVPAQIITAFLLALGIAWVYEKSGSLWSAIVLHIVNNGVAAVLVYIVPLFMA